QVPHALQAALEKLTGAGARHGRRGGREGCCGAPWYAQPGRRQGAAASKTLNAVRHAHCPHRPCLNAVLLAYPVRPNRRRMSLSSTSSNSGVLMRKQLRIALISEHASPLAASGGVDSGGQNVYVAQVARQLAKAGHAVDVLTRRDDDRTPTVTHMCPGVRVIQIDAGPPCFIPKEAMLPYMDAFTDACESLMRHGVSYDIVHANFFMSGLVAMRLKERLQLPYVVTFHALGLVRREHQKQADAFPPERVQIEREVAMHADAIIAECPQDEIDLERLYDVQPQHMRMVPCGFDSGEFGPMGREMARRLTGLSPNEFIILQLGRMVPRKGVDNVIQALAYLPEHMPARLVVVGGEAAEPDEERTPEIGRLRRVAQACGVADKVS